MNCLQGYNEDTFYCNDECDLDLLFVQGHVGGECCFRQLLMFQRKKRKEIHNYLRRSQVDSPRK